MILNKRISSRSIVSHLLILWHHRDTQNNPLLSQCLCAFFDLYIRHIPESPTVLEEIYLPTLKRLAAADEESKLREIDPLRVSEVIIRLTSNAIHHNYSMHNQLMYTILCEMLNPDTEIVLGVLMKSLKMLDVQLEGENMKNDILKALDDVEELVSINKLLILFNIFIYYLLSFFKTFSAKHLGERALASMHP